MQVKNSAVVYQGKSLIDGNPVVAIATGFNFGANTKLGSNVIQIWILRSDVSPVEAIKSGQDYSVCGDCPLRGKVCYVNSAHAPSQIYRSYHRGSYDPISKAQLDRMRSHNKILRLTAYGDCAAIPKSALDPLIQAAPHTIGYIHQWRTRSDWKGILQASCETKEDALYARSLGWQTFRIKNPDDSLTPGERHCTNQKNPATQCEDCRLCDGSTAAIAVDIHGLNWKKQNFQQL